MNLVLDLHDHLRGLGYADRTVTEYCKWARRLSRWCQLHGEQLPDLPSHRLRDWVEQTIPPGRDSRNLARAAAKHLFLLAGRTDRPWESIRVPRKRRKAPHPLADKDAAAILSTALLAGGRSGLAVVGLMLTGARPSEVAEWNWDRVDLDKRTITFWRIKTRDWHTVPLHATLAGLFERTMPAGRGDMFRGDRGRQYVAATTVLAWVKQIAALAGVEGVTCRRLRATAGTTAANKTRDIHAAAALLGHVDVAVTQHFYTLLSEERSRAAVDALDWTA